MARESKGSGDIGSRTSGLHVCGRDVSIYCMGLKMAAVEVVFEESLFQALNVINLTNVSVSKRRLGAIVYLLWQVIDFSDIALCF